MAVLARDTVRRKWLRGLNRGFVDPVLCVIFPSRCPGCDLPVVHPTVGPLCTACWQALPVHGSSTCRCGFVFADGIGRTCGRCRRGLNPLATGASLGPYEGSLRVLIHELKYRGRRRVASRLAEAMLGEESVRRVLTRGRIVVAVPLHPSRARDRGFNQAELLAVELGRRSQLTVGKGVLVRRRATQPQTGLSAAGRRHNVSGAFAVKRQGPIVRQSVILVDDVLTTGATAMACARELRAGGASEVCLVTAARVL